MKWIDLLDQWLSQLPYWLYVTVSVLGYTLVLHAAIYLPFAFVAWDLAVFSTRVHRFIFAAAFIFVIYAVVSD